MDSREFLDLLLGTGAPRIPKEGTPIMAVKYEPRDNREFPLNRPSVAKTIGPTDQERGQRRSVPFQSRVAKFIGPRRDQFADARKSF